MDFFDMEPTEWAPILVASIAVILALLQAYWQRRHDRLSVRPYIVYHMNWSKLNETRVCVQFQITNIGLGPAISNKFKLTYKGRESTWKFMGADALKHHTDADFRGSQMAEGQGLGIDETVTLGEYSFKTTPEFGLRDLLRLLDEASFELRYSSMYGEKQPPLIKPKIHAF